MTNAEELRERIRVMFVESWARWTPDERAQVLARLPAYQRDGLTKMIEDHNFAPPGQPIIDPPPIEVADLPPLPVVETEPSLPDGPSGELRFE